MRSSSTTSSPDPGRRPRHHPADPAGDPQKHGKVGLVHIDAHADVNDHMFGEKIAHGTTFRRAVEEGLLDCDRVVQIGLRAQGYTAEDFNWSRKQGFRVVQAEECWHHSSRL